MRPGDAALSMVGAGVLRTQDDLVTCLIAYGLVRVFNSLGVR